MRDDKETNEEVRTLIADPEEIHEVIAKAWEDTCRRWDKEAEPTCQNFDKNHQHLWDTQQKMDMGEL